MRAQGWMRAWRATTYLLSALATAVVTVLALPFLCHPAIRQPWAGWHRHRAGRFREVEVRPHDVPVRRFASWVVVHVAAGIPSGLIALLCAGNILVTAVVVPLWWVFPAEDPPRLLADVAVKGWGEALGLGLLQLALLAGIAYWVLPLLADVHARAGLAIMAPTATEQLAERVAVLTRTRTDVLHAHAAELRRIERDLHDGTQARLVAIAMQLALAREGGDPERVAELLRQAHEGAEAAMTELRETVRGIYPAILSDRGLPGAIRTVAARGGLPIQVDIGDLGPVPAAVEAVAYYAVTEALTNVAKHSGATRAAVRLGRIGDSLSVTISDDGKGGADETTGTGLAGIRGRVAALDGMVCVTSPAGGPTTIAMEIPCGW